MPTTRQWRRSVIKSWTWGSRPEATSLPPSILLSPLPSRGLNRDVWAEPAHPLPNILMLFMQSNSLITSTVMFNLLPRTEISVHAEFSHCRHIEPILWIAGHYSSMALKSGGPCTFEPPLSESGGQDPRTPTGSPPLIRAIFFHDVYSPRCLPPIYTVSQKKEAMQFNFRRNFAVC